MASIGLPICSTSKPLIPPSTSAAVAASSSSTSSCRGFRCSTGPVYGCRCSRIVAFSTGSQLNRSRRCTHVVCMAPDEEKLTRRNPLDFPLEWERPKPGRRPDIFPQFSPMKTPIPPPLPFDPPEEDEEEEEEEKKKEEEEEDPNKEEETEKPDKDQ